MSTIGGVAALLHLIDGVPILSVTGAHGVTAGMAAAIAETVTGAGVSAVVFAAAENGPLSATQFHPEKSGEPGIRLLGNWLRSL